MAVIVPIVSKYDNKGVKQAKGAFAGLSDGISKSLKKVAAAASVIVIADALKDSAKAAVADTKSQALLANQLKNTVGANNEQIASVEKSINAMSRMAAVADDDIRPAMAQLVRATGDVGSATKLTSLALDISASTGKDLTSVSTALGKAYQGNSTALSKLGINVKGMKDPLAELQKQFGGAAATAANVDPFKRMSITLGELQETIGRQVLPVFDMLATFIADNEETIGKIFESLGGVIQAIMPIIQPLLDLLIPILEIIMNLVEMAMPPLIEVFMALMPAIQPILDLFSVLVAELLPPLIKLINDVLVPVLQFLVDILITYVIPYFTRLAELFGGLLTAAVDGIVASFQWLQKIMAPIWENVLKPIVEGLMSLMGIKPVKLKVSATTTGLDRVERMAGAAGAASAFNFGGKITGATNTSGAKKKAKATQVVVTETEKIAIAAAEALKKQNEAFAEFTKSLKDVSTGIQPLIDAGVEIGKFEQNTIDGFDNITAAIKEGIANKTLTEAGAKNLLDYVATEKKALSAIARQRDELANKRSLVESLMADVKSAVVGFGNITSLLESETRTIEQTTTRMIGNLSVATKRTIEEVVSGNGIVGNLQGVLNKTKNFAEQLKQLRALGLDKNLYQQIVDAGVEAGSATAAAIIAGGANTVQELNNLYTELDTVGTSIAESSAVVMYNNGVDVAGGLVAGLMSQEQALIDTATALANAFTSTYNSLIGNLQMAAPEVATQDVTMTLSQLAKTDLSKTTGDQFWKENIALAKKLIASPKYAGNSTVTVTVNAGVGTNGKTVGQAIQAELNKYAKSSAK